MKIFFEVLNYVCVVCVFVLKVLYLHTRLGVLNTAAMVLICVFIVIQLIQLRKPMLMMAVFAFSFLAELFNLIYNGKSAITMLFYFGMHICFFVYLLRDKSRQKADMFYALPLCTFILFIAYSWGFWQQNILVYLAMAFYSLILCTNLTLSYGVNKKIFTGMLLVFLVDTIVVWSLVKGGVEDIRAISWLPFLIGEKLLKEGAISTRSSDIMIRVGIT
jgi:hypothetical protein